MQSNQTTLGTKRHDRGGGDWYPSALGTAPSSPLPGVLPLMMTIEKALALKEKGFNCCQAVFVPFATELGLSEAQALMLASPFGGGIARTGSVCGAVTGALMVIGLRYGMTSPEDSSAGEKTMALSRVFLEQFQEVHATTQCHALLGVDINTQAGFEAAKNEGRFTSICPQAISSAVEILEELI